MPETESEDDFPANAFHYGRRVNNLSSSGASVMDMIERFPQPIVVHMPRFDLRVLLFAVIVAAFASFFAWVMDSVEAIILIAIVACSFIAWFHMTSRNSYLLFDHSGFKMRLYWGSVEYSWGDVADFDSCLPRGRGIMHSYYNHGVQFTDVSDDFSKLHHPVIKPGFIPAQFGMSPGSMWYLFARWQELALGSPSLSWAEEKLPAARNPWYRFRVSRVLSPVPRTDKSHSR